LHIKNQNLFLASVFNVASKTLQLRKGTDDLANRDKPQMQSDRQSRWCHFSQMADMSNWNMTL